MARRLAAEGVSRSFPGVAAVQDVSVEFAPGRLHALVGENGAGKTTLMRLLFGMLRPDAGRILLDGEPVQFRSSEDAIARGLGMVHQHFMLVDTLSVAENLVLGAEPGSPLRLDRAAARRAVAESAERLSLELDPDLPAEDLSVGQAQMLEILKVLHRGADVLILDEPTGVLSPQETRFLFAMLRRLKGEGKTIVLITHKLDEVLALADCVDVMRRGRHVGRLEREDADAATLARMMVGREVLLRVEKPPATPGPVRLALKGLCVDRQPGVAPLTKVDLELRAGEIVGLAGVEGNGQRELAAVLAGLLPPDAGSIHLDGRRVGPLSPKRARALGIRLVPEDRQKSGLVLSMSLRENLILGQEDDPALSRLGFLRPAAVDALARRRIADYDLRVTDPGQLAAELSGGNQQKLILARELDARPRVLVAAQPTRGVDVGAIEAIHRQLLALRADGLAILLISSELPELLALSDRVAVLYKGRLVASFAADAVDEETLGLWMTGAAGAATPAEGRRA
ncbi:MAG: ABC transporter ATP-binding protein [Candidatus Latescibacteria bacterium]|nr:ABC transporter ATP-binding protein [Candidatus Latescibacterota bacterium]